MSAHGPIDEMPTDVPDPTYEDRDINLRALGVFGGVVIFVAVMTWILMSVMFDVLSSDDEETLRRIPEVGPVLQAFPIQELAKYEELHEKHLQSYSWVDATNKIAAIPIDVAMKIALQTEFGTAMDKYDLEALKPDRHGDHGHSHGHDDGHADEAHPDKDGKAHDASDAGDAGGDADSYDENKPGAEPETKDDVAPANEPPADDTPADAAPKTEPDAPADEPKIENLLGE